MKRLPHIVAVGFVWITASVGSIQADDGKGGVRELEFARDVLPILSNHCFSCHGPDEASRQAGLRLDRRRDAIRVTDGVAPVVPGRPQASEVVRRIRSSDEDIVMPPPDAIKPLSNRQKGILQQWIAEGAEYKGHWAFRSPKRNPLPTIRARSWPRNAIDHFVLKRLEASGLKPTRMSTRQTWLRRVTLDLTGLPPSIEELNAFLSDLSPTAASRVVDRLLSTDAHAERMAMHWLDAARYADTNGYNNDEIRTMWPWRDWVIRAFRTGLPYDRFLTQQLAGDLLPDPSLSQRVATGFNRNHVLTTEGGIIPAEYQAEYVADRVHTAATVFMGISLQCARCHDHKFDPFTQRDFYRFGAYFNNIPDKLVTFGAARMADPVLKVPSGEQRRELDRWIAKHKSFAAQIKARDDQLEARTAAWEASLSREEIARLGSTGQVALFKFDEKGEATVINSIRGRLGGKIRGSASREKGVLGTALRFDGKTYIDAGQIGKFDRDDSFSLAAWFRPEVGTAGAILSKMDDHNSFRGYDVLFMNGKVECHIVHHWPDKAFKVVTKRTLPLAKWHHVAVSYDGSRQAGGVRLFVNGKQQAVDIPTNNRLTGPITTDKPFHIGKRQTSLPFRGLLDDVRLIARTLSADDVGRIMKGKSLRRLSDTLAIPAKDRSNEQRQQVRRFYQDRIDTKTRRMRDELQTIARRIAAINKEIPVTMVMREMPKRRPTHILIRGQYDKRGEVVMPGLPVSLRGNSARPEGSRLDLARWLTDPAHPLTARVAVNRWWEMLFGTGLVRTTEDFGVQGDRPSHPDLLDWLATELIRREWDQRSILKMIVLSATYRQSSHVTSERLRIDPRNRLLSRGPRWRLPAEMVRDNALAISGLLHARVGGPSVRPYQPAGLWEDVSVLRRDKYVADKGAGLYRRSMYTFWKRTCPPPSMSAFDAPDRETCVIRRARTNTPLQALVLLNDPTYLEAARVFASRVVHHDDDDQRRINFAFRCAVSRLPLKVESAVVRDLLSASRKRFTTHPEAAGQLLSVGRSAVDKTIAASELAAWTAVASILLNLDETISKP